MNPFLDAHGVVDLGDVEVDPEADGDQVGEQQDEPEDIDVPGAVEALQADHDERQRHCGHKQQLEQNSSSRAAQY